MADKVVDFLLSITENPYLIVLLVSMVPLIELKGAIVIGAKLGVGFFESFALAYLGSTLVVLAAFFIIKYVFALLKKIPFVKMLVLKVEDIIWDKAKALAEKSRGKEETVKEKIIFYGLLVFVAIPLPLTGVWMGGAMAVFLGTKFFIAAIALSLGNFIAGGLITLLTWILHDYVDTVLNVLLILVLVMLALLIIKVIVKKPNASDGDKEEK